MRNMLCHYNGRKTYELNDLYLYSAYIFGQTNFVRVTHNCIAATGKFKSLLIIIYIGYDHNES